jgi:hypothetical protein
MFILGLLAKIQRTRNTQLVLRAHRLPRPIGPNKPIIDYIDNGHVEGFDMPPRQNM